jgi:AAA15 family ATPase/GTPase
MILTDNDNNSFVQNIEKKFDVLYSDDSYPSIDQSSCTNKFMNLTLTEKKNDKSILIPVSNSCLTD